MRFQIFTALLVAFTFAMPALAAGNDMQWVAIRAKNREARTAIVNHGVSIETTVEDMAYGFGTEAMIEKLQSEGFEIVSYFPASEIRTSDFPAEDALFHNYAELGQELDALIASHPNLVRGFSIGTSVEGRQIRGIRINPNATDALTPSGLPGAVYMGGHHAREHLSVEIPLMFAKFLVEHYDSDPLIKDLLSRRDIFIIPMINVDGAEFDIASGHYQMWRKNRNNMGSSRCPGVDLNRNYSFKWGTGGSSNEACSDVFMGPKPFSEPETIAVKNFVEGHPNLKVLLTLHTYSELVLYPWGNTYDPIAKVEDHNTFKKMADTMAGWNGYTSEQTSDLYIASGDTTDWAYGALGIFAFTFELSPKDTWGGGGFYPGAGAIQNTFNANIKPMLYLLDLADDPHRAVTMPQTTLFYGR